MFLTKYFVCPLTTIGGGDVEGARKGCRKVCSALYLHFFLYALIFSTEEGEDMLNFYVPLLLLYA